MLSPDILQFLLKIEIYFRWNPRRDFFFLFFFEKKGNVFNVAPNRLYLVCTQRPGLCMQQAQKT